VASSAQGAATGAYRPPQWAGPAMVSLTVAPTTQPSSVDANGVPTIDGTATTTYVFDAVLMLEHEQRLEKTHHPVQTGADISSHAYLMPARCSLDVGMSDAMDSYSTGVRQTATGSASVTPWTGTSTSKSVNAYQTVIALQAARQPITLTTRLRTYSNMVITSVAPHEDHKTIAGLRMRVEFEQIFTASATTTPVTARPDATQSAGLGQVNPTAVPAATQQQFQAPPAAAPIAYPPLAPSNSESAAMGLSPIGVTNYVDVPGSGAYASPPGQQGLP
jgi:hypothetical protein